MTAPVQAVRDALSRALLEPYDPTGSGYVLSVEGSTLVVTFREAELAGRRMPTVPYLPASEVAEMLTDADAALRAAGLGVARRAGALVVGRDLVDVLGGALGRDLEAEERGRHEIEMRGDAA